MLDVALLGTGGMMPLPNRFLTSLLCRLNGRMMLIDCGEGTQVSMKMLGWGFKNIDVICFTHFHADHISGLPGLLLTIGNAGRTEPLHVVGPPGLKEVVASLCVIAPELPFELYTTTLEKQGDLSVKIGALEISAFPMQHGVDCLAYCLDVKRRGKFDLERAMRLNIPRNYWSLLQKSHSVEYEGRVYTDDMVLGPPRKGIKVAYATDSRPPEGLAGFIKDADLFICEGLYGEDDKLEKAAKHRHMIFREAAQIARDGHVSELWLTHFSPALTTPKMFLQNATDVFPNTKVGFDRMATQILFGEHNETI